MGRDGHDSPRNDRLEHYPEVKRGGKLTMKILVAVLLCDRKAHFQLTPVSSILAQSLEQDQEIIPYFNIETTTPGFDSVWKPLGDRMNEWSSTMGVRTREWHADFWHCRSSWWKPPTFDQDQARLVPICEARNRAIEAAIELRCDALLFVDSDMEIPPYSVKQLLSHNRPIVGGLVHGRNAHKSARYVFGNVGGIRPLDGGLVECDHGNIGFCLIRSNVFSVLRFRRGPHCTLGHLQSDDPNFCFDALHKWGFGRHVVDLTVEAVHVDETRIPFEHGAQF